MSETPSPSDWYGASVDEELVRICAHNLLAAIDEAIYFKDQQSRFILVSRGQARRLGADSPADVVGKTDRDFFGDEHYAKSLADEQHILHTGEPLRDKIESLTWPGRGPQWVTATKMALRDFDGRPLGTFGISHDITRCVVAEQDAEAKSQALAASHAQLLRSQEELQARQEELERTAAALEQRARELSAVADVARAALSDADVRTAVCAAARDLAGADIACLVEPDGKGNLTITAQAGFVIPRMSLPLGQRSLAVDAFTTQQSQVAQDIRNHPAMSPAVVSMLEEIVGHPLGSVFCVPVLIENRCLGVLTTTMPVHDTDAAAFVQVLEILAHEAAAALERADLHQRLQEQATQDVLTGLANRRAILDQLDQAVARARRHNRGLGLLYLDLDGFKTVNDSYGHATGDAVLVEVAARLRNVTRIEDNVGRIGGDEFVAICEDLEGGGESLKARLSAAIAQPYAELGVDVPIGASIGIAIWQADDDADTLLARADHAMYADKAARGAWPASMPSTAVLRTERQL